MSEATFRTDIRGAVRGLWSGAIDKAQFNRAMSVSLKLELSRAWGEGAKECGIALDELTDDEIASRDDFIEEQQGYISGFAEAIQEADSKDKSTIFPLFERAKMWINRYGDAKERAKEFACSDQKLIWIVGPTEHCADCASYNGKVYRGSVWGEIRPKSPCLNCGGFRCQCRREPTNKRASRGKPKPMSKC